MGRGNEFSRQCSPELDLHEVVKKRSESDASNASGGAFNPVHSSSLDTILALSIARSHSFSLSLSIHRNTDTDTGHILSR